MYRKPGSTMTAVEVVASRYDGPIPHDVLMEARAEDARFAASPASFAAEDATSGVAWNTRCARDVITKIRGLNAAGKVSAAEHERDWTLCCHLKARRLYQAQVRQIMQGVA